MSLSTVEGKSICYCWYESYGSRPSIRKWWVYHTPLRWVTSKRVLDNTWMPLMDKLPNYVIGCYLWRKYWDGWCKDSWFTYPTRWNLNGLLNNGSRYCNDFWSARKMETLRLQLWILQQALEFGKPLHDSIYICSKS